MRAPAFSVDILLGGGKAATSSEIISASAKCAGKVLKPGEPSQLPLAVRGRASPHRSPHSTLENDNGRSRGRKRPGKALLSVTVSWTFTLTWKAGITPSYR